MQLRYKPVVVAGVFASNKCFLHYVRTRPAGH